MPGYLSNIPICCVSFSNTMCLFTIMEIKILTTLQGSIPKTVMNDVPSAPIGDFENEQRESSAALFKCRDRFPNGPFGERTLHRGFYG